MNEKKRFVVKGKQYFISREDVINAIKTITPDIVRKYYVQFEGKEYSITKILYEIIKENSPGTFSTNSAMTILRKLDFDIKQWN
jgi:predicted transcriptional regulator